MFRLNDSARSRCAINMIRHRDVNLGYYFCHFSRTSFDWLEWMLSLAEAIALATHKWVREGGNIITSLKNCVIGSSLYNPFLYNGFRKFGGYKVRTFKLTCRRWRHEFFVAGCVWPRVFKFGAWSVSWGRHFWNVLAWGNMLLIIIFSPISWGLYLLEKLNNYFNVHASYIRF